MRIVVVDGHTLNPGDLSWRELEALGEVTVYERTPPAEIVARTSGAEVVLTNKVVLSRAVIGQLPALRFVGVTATGYNVVDMDATRERRIAVSNVPAYATPAVTQMVFAHLMNLTLHVAEHSESVRRGCWSASPDFCYWDYPLVELAGLTLGVVGFGRIGRAVARAASAFDMQVLACEPGAPVSQEGVRLADLETVFRESDVVTLHCPLTPQTERLVNARRLALMKPTAFLINTGRGPLVDEPALAEALNAGRIAGAGLDVLSVEPPPRDHPLLKARNCYITPHIAWATRAARQRLLDTVVENVRAFLAGRPQNVVNGV